MWQFSLSLKIYGILFKIHSNDGGSSSNEGLNQEVLLIQGVDKHEPQITRPKQFTV